MGCKHLLDFCDSVFVCGIREFAAVEIQFDVSGDGVVEEDGRYDESGDGEEECSAVVDDFGESVSAGEGNDEHPWNGDR